MRQLPWRRGRLPGPRRAGQRGPSGRSRGVLAGPPWALRSPTAEGRPPAGGSDDQSRRRPQRGRAASQTHPGGDVSRTGHDPGSACEL